MRATSCAGGRPRLPGTSTTTTPIASCGAMVGSTPATSGISITAGPFLTGRAKDIIIRAGRNLHPEELEQALGSVDGDGYRKCAERSEACS